MSKQTERKLIIVLSVIVIILMIILTTMLILLAVRTQRIEPEKLQEEVVEKIEVEVETTTSTLPVETEHVKEVLHVENASYNAAKLPENELVIAQSLEYIIPETPMIQEMNKDELIRYLKTVEGAVQESIDVIGKDWIVELTKEEFKEFCILVFAESGAECLDGQIAVAATVINRMLNEVFPDTCHGVIIQSSQFSVVKNGYIVSSITSFEELPDVTIEAVLRVLQGEDPTEEMLWKMAVELGVDPVKYAKGGALYFYNPMYCYRNPKVVISIGNHNFHKVWED